MTVRELREGDSDQILDLVKECGPYVVPYNVYAYWILENYYPSTCKVVEDNNRIIGFVSSMPTIDRSLLFVWQMCVHRDYRGKGAAVMLLDALFDTAREMKFERMELSIAESNSASMNLIKKYAGRNSLNIIEKKKFPFGDMNEIVYEIDLLK